MNQLKLHILASEKWIRSGQSVNWQRGGGCEVFPVLSGYRAHCMAMG